MTMLEECLFVGGCGGFTAPHGRLPEAESRWSTPRPLPSPRLPSLHERRTIAIGGGVSGLSVLRRVGLCGARWSDPPLAYAAALASAVEAV